MVTSIGSILDGPLLGLFVLGMFFPCAGKKGAFVGGWVSLVTMIFLVGKIQWNVITKKLRYHPLPTLTNNCPYPLNETIIPRPTLPPLLPEEEPIFLFKISILHFTLIGALVVIIVGLIVSYLTNEMDSSAVDPDHISPLLHR